MSKPLKDFIECVIGELIAEGTSIRIEEVVNEGRVTFKVTAPRKERGKIIGKNGDTISAIRTLVVAKAAASGDNRYFMIKVVD